MSFFFIYFFIAFPFFFLWYVNNVIVEYDLSSLYLPYQDVCDLDGSAIRGVTVIMCARERMP